MELIKTVILLFLLTACATKTQKREPIPVPGPEYATLVFKRGNSSLSNIDKNELNELAIKANRDGREIKSYKVFAWSDKEYPHGDSKLAEKRGKIVKKYISQDLNSQERIQVYNMAKEPSAISSALESDEANMKRIIKNSEPSATELPNGEMSYTKASKALVIIDYRDEERI